MNVTKDELAKKRDSQKSFVVDVVTLVGGTTIAQIISIISAPLITRLYGADAFGLSALFSSVVNIFAVIACLRYELSIMLPKTDEEAANLLALSLFITSVISLILVPIVWLFGGSLASLLKSPALLPFLWFVPPMIFLSGSFSAINYWNSRQRQFGRLSKTQVARAATTSGTQLGVGLAGYSSGGSLIGASVLGQLVATATLGYQAWKSDKTTLQSSVNFKGIISGLKKYEDFPKFDVWSALINALSLQLPIFIISAFFTTTIVGYYSLGLMVLQLPMSFIGGAIAQVFFQRAAEANNFSKSNLSSAVEGTVGRLIVLGLFPILLLSLIGKDVFTIIFGTEWAQAGVYSQILSFFILIQFVTSPISSLFSIQKKLRAFLIINILLLLSRTIPLIWGGINGDIYLGLILLSIFGGIGYLIMGRWILDGLAISYYDIIKSQSKPIMTGFGILLIFVFIRLLFSFDSLSIVLISIPCIISYYGLIFLKKMI